MKFREYVGEGKVKEVKKKIIRTNIGTTEEDFLKHVLREKPDGTKIQKRSSTETFLGFGLSKQKLKRVFDYIKSWLIRYDVPFEAVNPYLTLYLLRNLPKSSSLADKIKPTKSGVVYKPMGTITIASCDERDFPMAYNLEPKNGKDYILIDYEVNQYNDILEDIFDDMDINVISKQGYVKLFEIDNGVMTHKMYADMMYSCPKFPNLKLGNIGFLRSK